MDMSTVLESAHGYLQQLSNIEGDHAIEVPPILFETLKSASIRAKVELESLFPIIVMWLCNAYDSSNTITNQGSEV